MSNLSKNIIFFLVAFFGGLYFLLPGIYDGTIGFTVRVISYINFILLLTSLVCIGQFFWPGETNHTPFHVFNIIFTLVFYLFSLDFLVHHKSYYDGYAQLNDIEVIKRFAFRWDMFSIMFWIIVFTLVINIVYVARNQKSYLQYN